MGKGKSKTHQIDLSTIKCIVIDEADEFFTAEKEMKPILDLSRADAIANRNQDNKVQWVLFSATFGHEALQDVVMQNIKKIIQQANQIMLKTEKLKLHHIKQFHLRCEPHKKLDFIKEVFDTCEAAQSFIFVNNKDFAEKVHNWLLRADYKSYIMFSKMSKEERDETMAKFRRQEIKVLITTNLIARGIDVPEVDLVINYDVPQTKDGARTVGDAETYLHRIGRAGRFGAEGIALTIYDRDVDKEYLDQIIKTYEMESMINPL
jgi:ATP-dependent RNA helicase DDX19/DBP5